ncbi:MAG: aminotransferase class V-fold PLP-dependent enzyme [Halanaerobiaceae bacterium]
MANYEELGVKKVINAAGTYTKYGGSLMSEEVLQAMQQAATQYVDIDQLLIKSGQYISDLLGVESALVTAGAAAGLTISSAAAMLDKDDYRITHLPRTETEKKEIIVMRCHRNPYDQALEMSGARIKEIGNAIETEPLQLKGAINDQTAAVVFFAQSAMFRASLTLKQVTEICDKFNVPVIVDAAAELPPLENLTSFYEQGATAVLFSGGKDIRGPQSSGLIIGTKDFIEKCRQNSYPHHAVGRPMKLDKETIMGFVRALELYLKEDHQQRRKYWQKITQKMVGQLKDLKEIEGAKVDYPTQPYTQPAVIPRAYLKFAAGSNLKPQGMARKLKEKDPAIVVVTDKEHLILNPQMLEPGEEEVVIKSIRELL